MVYRFAQRFVSADPGESRGFVLSSIASLLFHRTDGSACAFDMDTPNATSWLTVLLVKLPFSLSREETVKYLVILREAPSTDTVGVVSRRLTPVERFPVWRAHHNRI